MASTRKSPTKPNAPDATRRNVRHSNSEIANLKKRVGRLERKVVKMRRQAAEELRRMRVAIDRETVACRARVVRESNHLIELFSQWGGR